METSTGAIAQRLREVRAEIEAEATKHGKHDVDLLLATKTVPAARIREALVAGGTLIGENRVQELTEKAPELADLDHASHFIGHLQTNKINQVLRHASCIQSIDSTRLADNVSKRWHGSSPLEVFIQVNTSGEESKYGSRPEEATELAGHIGADERLHLRGFMTIGLFSDDTAAVRRSYERLRGVRDEIGQQHITGTEDARELSMGMSGDFHEAIAEGATMVRLGTTVFGKRPTSDAYYWPGTA